MDWVIDAAGLISTSGTCCGQDVWSVNDTSAGRSGTQELLVGGGPDLRRSRLDSSSWMRCVSNLSTAVLHEERQSALSIASASISEGAMPQRFSVDLRLVTFVLSTRTPGTVMELSIEDLLRKSCHPYELHVNVRLNVKANWHTPCSLNNS